MKFNYIIQKSRLLTQKTLFENDQHQPINIVATGCTRLMFEICDHLWRYAAYSGNFLPTFRSSQDAQNSRVKSSTKSFWKSFFLEFLTLEDGTAW